MEGYLSLYQCRTKCHVFLVTWAEQTADEKLANATFVVTIIPKTQHGAIRDRVTGVDFIRAVRAEFQPMVKWVECYAALTHHQIERPSDPENRCWESKIRKAATNLVDVEGRFVPLVSAPYAI